MNLGGFPAVRAFPTYIEGLEKRLIHANRALTRASDEFRRSFDEVIWTGIVNTQLMALFSLSPSPSPPCHVPFLPIILEDHFSRETI